MPRSAARPWRARASEAYDAYVFASIKHVNGKHHPDTGAYGSLIIRGIPDQASAETVKKGLFASAKWLHEYKGLNCSMSAKPKKNPDGTYRVEFTVYNKDHAYNYISKTYGDDPEKRPYSPYSHHKNYDAPTKDAG
jgi:hypothetical protein